MREKLSDRFAAKARPGIYFDTDPRSPSGFLLRVTPSGNGRSWCLDYRVKDTQLKRRPTIGQVAAWPIAEARAKAAEWRRIVDDGGDPLADMEEKRAAPTVAELVDRYVEEELPKRAPRTQAEYRSMLRRWILPALGHRKVAAVTREDIEKLHGRITAAGLKRRANATKGLCSTLFTRAIVWRMRADNPTAHVEGNREDPRQRYLSEDEIARLLAALDCWQARRPDAADAIRLLLLTGARRGEVLSMRWPEIDLDNAVWTKPPSSTKQRMWHRVPLSPEAVDVLRRRQAERDGKVVRLRDDHVFRGGNDAAHQARLRDVWEIARAEAGLTDVHLHDLRHTFASLLVGQGLSLPIVGAMLGHSKPATTARYAHLADAPLREAAAIVGRIVGKSAK